MLYNDRPGLQAAAALVAAALLLPLAGAAVAAAAGVEDDRGQSTHVLIGLTPSTALDVLVEGEALSSGPVVVSELGIATFTINDDAYPAGPISVVVAPAGDLVITGPWVEALTPTSATVRWRTSAPATSFVEYGLTNAYGHASAVDPLLVTDHTVALNGLSPGTTYHYRVQSGDDAGQVALSADGAFETELAPLTVSGVETVDVGTTWAVIAWTTNRASDSRVEYGATAEYGSSSPLDPSMVTAHTVTLTALLPGTIYHFRVQSDDHLGDVALSADREFETRREPLAVSDVHVVDVGTTWAVVAWTSNRAADSQIEYGRTPGYGSWSPLDPSMVTAHSVTLTALLPGTLYHFRVRSDDHLGDVGLSGDFSLETDVPRLLLSDVRVADLGPSSAVIEWDTDRPATSVVEYGPTDTYGMDVSPGALLTMEHSVTVSGLADGTLYHFRAVSTDGYGTTAASADSTFTTAPIEPTGPPVIETLVADQASASWALVTWTTDRPATSEVRYGTRGVLDCRSPRDTTLTCEHAVPVGPVVPMVTYTFVAVSACGADTTVSSAGTFRTDAPLLDPALGRPVEIVRPEAVRVDATSVVIRWAVDRTCSSWLEYGTSDSYGVTVFASPFGTNAFEAEIDGLAPGTPYHYRAHAWDRIGGYVSGEDLVFTTAEPPDAEPPAPPQGLVLSLRDGAVDAAWDANDEADLLGYYVYRARGEGDESDWSRAVRLNEAPLPVTEFSDLSAEPGAMYSYVVTAVDQAGNESAASGAAAIRVDGGEEEPPSIEFAAYPNPVRDTATFAFNLFRGDETARVRIIGVDGRLVAEILDDKSGAGVHTVTWNARDSLGTPVGGGVYLCELRTSRGDVSRRKLTVLR
jgi:hypothetical protein